MSRSLVALIASVMLAGCYIGPIDGNGGTYRSPQTAPVCGDSVCQASESCSTCSTDCGVCVSGFDVDLGSAATLAVDGSTVGRRDLVGVSCGDGGYAPEIAYRWTAPSAGTWLVSLSRSDFAAVLDVRSGTSTGRALACLQVSGLVRSLELNLAAYESVVFVVDGARGASGSFRLEIEPLGPRCGDRSCELGESCSTCPTDCGSCSRCGDGFCSAGEDAWSCATDCAPASVCGDSICDYDEDGWLCPEDCDVCEGYCGDGFCGGGEDGWSCASDCQASCGDGYCDWDEDGWSCATDCTATCGDGFCDPTEDGFSCSADCTSSCGDGYCSSQEDVWSCSRDCGVLCPG